MLALLYVTRILAGKSTFAEVPAVLKAQVAEALQDAGVPELAE